MIDESTTQREIRVLVVEDDVTQSAIIERRLRLASFAVDACACVSDAVNLIADKEYAVAVVDLNLGGETGLDFVRHLTNIGSKTRVILHSIEASFESAKEGINLGVFAYVEKGAKAEQLLEKCHRAAAAYLRLNLEAANDEIAFQLRLLDAVDHGIVATDLKGNVIYWNRFSAQLTGIKSREAIGKSIADYLSMPSVELASLMQEVKKGGSWQGDCQLHPSASDALSTPIRIVASGIKDSKGVLSGSVLSYHDLTTTLAKEKSLSLRAKLLLVNAELARSAVEIAERDAFLMETLIKVDEGLFLSAGRVVLKNAATKRNECIAEFGDQRNLVEGAIELVEVDQLQLDRVINGFRIPLYELGEWVGCIEGALGAAQSIGAEKRDFLQSVASLAACVLLRSWAITEKRRSEKVVAEQQDQLAHVQRTATIGHMAAALAHEINQPLGSISNFAGGLLCGMEKDSSSENELTTTLGFIRDEAIRAGAIVGRLRKYVSLDRFNVERVNFNSCIHDTLQILKYFLTNMLVKIELQLDPDIPLVQADAIRFQQVLVNVIKNSAEAMQMLPESDRRISVQTSYSNGWVQVSIADKGPAISDSEFNNLFQPYSTTKVYGLGMGLCISKSIVEQHHGNMTMSRIRPNGMLTTIRIPIA